MSTWNPFSMPMTPLIAGRFKPDHDADGFTKLRCALMNHIFSTKMLADNPFFVDRPRLRPVSLITSEGTTTHDLLIDDAYFRQYGLGSLPHVTTTSYMVGKIAMWGSLDTFQNQTRFNWNIEVSVELRDDNHTMIRIPRTPPSPYTRGYRTAIRIHGSRAPLGFDEVVGWRDIVRLLRMLIGRVYEENGEGEDNWELVLYEMDEFWGRIHSFVGNSVRKNS